MKKSCEDLRYINLSLTLQIKKRFVDIVWYNAIQSPWLKSPFKPCFFNYNNALCGLMPCAFPNSFTFTIPLIKQERGLLHISIVKMVMTKVDFHLLFPVIMGCWWSCWLFLLIFCWMSSSNRKGTFKLFWNIL